MFIADIFPPWWDFVLGDHVDGDQNDDNDDDDDDNDDNDDDDGDDGNWLNDDGLPPFNLEMQILRWTQHNHL